MPYQIKVDGNTWRTDDLTLDEAIQIEIDADTNWGLINPFKSAKDAKAVLTAFMGRTDGRAGALNRVGKMTLTQILECIDIVEDDRPEQFEEGIPSDPKEPSTAT